MIRVLMHGATGRMGRRISALVADDSRVEIVASMATTTSVDDVMETCAEIDVVIDFSTPEGTSRACSIASDRGCALLVGTTGLSRQNLDDIDVLARSHPVMIAPNTSRGVAVLEHLVRRAVTLLGNDFDVDLVDTHHAGKRDAPSGTARRLTDVIAAASGHPIPDDRVHAIRAGDVIGDHIIYLSGPGERLQIGHFATNRDLFARGAIDAAVWLVEQPAGSWTITDALGL